MQHIKGIKQKTPHLGGVSYKRLVHPARFELATPWFEAKYSNPLSYGCICANGLYQRNQLSPPWGGYIDRFPALR